ncbi:MAG TPA: DHH family phosphoesterase [Candidatus Saccharimonadales bacterium]|nr:DHH family phosphoesterase [Candidatus Saccharimonadales bacterium]
MLDKLKQLIDQSERVLITSHISPDPDAVCSSLLLAQTLKLNYRDKTIKLVLEELPNKDLAFLDGYVDIEFSNLADAIERYKPDLSIIVDANRWDRVSRNDGGKVADYIKANSVATAIIDHHEPMDKDDADVYINSGLPASVQEVYEICFKNWGLQKSEGWAETAMLGLMTDTYRFKYKNPHYRETFAMAADLIEAGADIEQLDNRLEHREPGELKIFAELANNFTVGEGYNYSFVSDTFAEQWRPADKQNDFKSACELFTNQFLRSTGSNKWGFLLRPELEGPAGQYSVSFRAESGAKDVSAIARTLGGGGHQPAAGAKFSAESLQKALEAIKQAIENTGSV